MQAVLANLPSPYYGVDGSRSPDAKKHLAMRQSVPVNPVPAKQMWWLRKTCACQMRLRNPTRLEGGFQAAQEMPEK